MDVPGKLVVLDNGPELCKQRRVLTVDEEHELGIWDLLNDNRNGACNVERVIDGPHGP